MGRVPVELRLLRQIRPNDAGRVVRTDPSTRSDFLRRRRLAGDGTRSHIALGLAHSVAAPIRPVCQPATVPSDAWHSIATGQPQAGRHRFRCRAREYRRRILIGRRTGFRQYRPGNRISANDLHPHRRRPDPQVRIRTWVYTSAETRNLGHQSNGISITMPYWDERFRAMSARYPDIRTDQFHIDILSAQFVQHPDWFDVVVGSNLFGDILSDLGPAVCGTIGIAPAANINPERIYPSTFEPVHGSAPDIAGKGISNPIGQIWSAALMLEHLGHAAAVAAMLRAIETVLADKSAPRTPDLGGLATTEALGKAIAEAIT